MFVHFHHFQLVHFHAILASLVVGQGSGRELDTATLSSTCYLTLVMGQFWHTARVSHVLANRRNTRDIGCMWSALPIHEQRVGPSKVLLSLGDEVYQ